MNIGEFFVRLRPDAKGFADEATGDIKKSLGATVQAIGGGLVARGAFNFLKQGAQGLMEIEKIGAQTSAAIKSTGGAANVSAKQVDEYAQSIEDMSGIEAESVKTAENLLLTFTNVRNGVGKGNDIFKQATSILADMSVALGTDVSGSAIQLGKALNDPISGITALTRVGVTFSDEQKKMIESLVESGDIMGAQRVILAELAKEFGGSAEALGETAAGKLNKFKNAIGDLKESAASAALPFVTSLLPAAMGFLQAITPIAPVLVPIVGLLGALVGITKAYTAVSAALNIVLKANPLGIIITALAILIPFLIQAWKKSAAFRDVVKSIWEWIKKAAAAVGEFFKKLGSLKIVKAFRPGSPSPFEQSLANMVGHMRDLKRLTPRQVGLPPMGVPVPALAGVGAVGGDSFITNVYNPTSEPASISVPRELRKIQYLRGR